MSSMTMESLSMLSFPHMLPIILSPIPTLAVALVFQEITLASQVRKCGLFALIIVSTNLSIGFSSTLNPIWSYGWGLFNAWAAIVWTPLWLWCLDPCSCQRLHRRMDCQPESPTLWVVQQRPSAPSFARLYWIADLLTDIRAVAWSHGLRKDSPWHKIRASPGQEKKQIEPKTASDCHRPSALIQGCLLRCVVLCAETELLSISANYYAHSLHDVDSRPTLEQLPGTVSRALVVAACVYCLISIIHTATTLVQMFWFFARTRQAPPIWMFPALFRGKISWNLASK
jgi:hypothetical protein